MTFRVVSEIRAWVLAQELAVDIYQLTSRDAVARDFGFRDQLRRAAVSISSNIAEGFGRGGDREFVRFLDIARGSAHEVLSLLHLSSRLGYSTPEETSKLLGQLDDVIGRIAGLQNYLRNPRAGEALGDYQL